MTPERALVAYRFHVTDIDRWPEPVVQAFYNHLTKGTPDDVR